MRTTSAVSAYILTSFLILSMAALLPTMSFTVAGPSSWRLRSVRTSISRSLPAISFSTTTISLSGSRGLSAKLSAPSLSARTTVPASPKADSMMTQVWLSSRRISFSMSKPLLPGILMSRSTRSGLSCMNLPTASSDRLQAVTTKPLSLSNAAQLQSSSTLSSTMRAFLFILRVSPLTGRTRRETALRIAQPRPHPPRKRHRPRWRWPSAWRKTGPAPCLRPCCS